MRCEMTAAAVLVLGAIGAAGCATPGHDKETWESAWHGQKAAASPPGAKGPKLAAQEYIPPLDCERRARVLRSQDRNAAWSALRGCAARGHFTQLRALVA